MASDNNTGIKKYLLISLGIHVAVFLLLFFWDLIKPEPRVTSVTYVTLSLGNGGTNTKASLEKLQGLPSSTIRDQREALKKLAELKELPKEKTDKPPPLDSKLAEEKAQPLVDKKKIIIGGGQEKQPPDKNKTDKNDPLAKINERLRVREEQAKQIEIGSGQSKNGETGQSMFGGENGTALDPARIAYYNALIRKIQNVWVLSKDKFDGALLARIEVMIDANGRVVSTSFGKTSGDGSFDESALRALKLASPFPIPPPSVRDEALKEGFGVTFHPTGVTK